MAIKAWAVGCLAFGMLVGVGPPTIAQGFLPPRPGADLDRVSRGMAEALRELVRDVAAETGRLPNGPYLTRDCRELERSTGEWYGQTRGTTDPYQLRRSYSGIDTSWHRLRGQLAAPGVANPAILEKIARVEQADAEIHQALNLNPYAPNLEGGASAPSGVEETRRLAYALAQRGEALASEVQAAYGPIPQAGSLVVDAIEVARIADGFSDGFNNPNGIPPFEAAQQSFVPLVQKSTNLGINLDRNPMPHGVRATWTAYTNALNLARENLKLANSSLNPPGQFNGPIGGPYNPNPAPQVAQWADGLDRQVDELIANFAPTAVVVPEGRDILGEMERLRDDVRNFRGDAALGLDPGRLAFEFREVDADWQRLARRVGRIARGRTGPNIQRVQQIGQTCDQIHQVLGMPGYPPIISPYRD